MKKLLVLVLVLVFALSGCGSSGGNTGGSNNKVLSIITHPAYSVQASDAKRADYIKNNIKAFEKSHKGFTIKNDVLSSNTPEAMAKLLEQASQGRAPDAAQIDSYIMPRYYKYLQPLDGLMKENNISLDDFFPFAQKVMKGPDGKIYGIQFTTDTRVLYYRKDLVPVPPKTWDDVLKIGKELKKKGYNAFLYPGGRGEGMIVTTLLPMYWGQGGKLVDDKGNPVFGIGQNKEKMLNVLNFLDKTVKTGITPKRVATYGAENDLNQEIANKKVAMFLGGNWQASQIKNIFGEQEFNKWAVAPVPQMAGAQDKTTAGGWAFGIFTKDKAKQKAIFDYLKATYFGNEGMAKWTSIAGYLPVRKSIYDSKDYVKNKFTNDFKDMLNNNAQMRPSAEKYPDISNALQVAVSSVVSGAKSPEQALDDAWNSVK